MIEKNFQSLFTKWIRKNPPNESCAFELKIVKKGAMPFSAVAEHQIDGLHAAEWRGMYHKISDMSREKKPFDCFYMYGAKAYLVVWWYKPRQPKEMIWIDISSLMTEMTFSKRKSLTEARAKEIGMVVPF